MIINHFKFLNLFDEINKKSIRKDEYKMFMDSLMTEMSQLTIPQYGTQLNDNSSKLK